MESLTKRQLEDLNIAEARGWVIDSFHDIEFRIDSLLINYNEILQQNMISTATLNTSWEGTNRSISISVYRDQNLQNGNISENLPSLSFSQSQIYPFKSGKSSLEPKWYELIGLNYNAQLLNTHTKIRNDQTGDYSQNYRRGIKHDVSFNISPKLGNFNISPSISYSELWYDTIKKESAFNSNQTFVIDFAINNETYNLSSYVTSRESFIINFSYDTTTYDAVIYFWYNNKSYLPTRIENPINTIATINLDVPAISGNYTFYWQILLTSGSDAIAFNSIAKNQTLNDISLSLCNTTNNISFFNITFFRR